MSHLSRQLYTRIKNPMLAIRIKNQNFLPSFNNQAHCLFDLARYSIEMCCNHLYLLFTWVFTFALQTHSLPSLLNANQSSDNEHFAAQSMQYQKCHADVTTLRIELADCFSAISRLPFSIKGTMFHNNPPFDAFYLPRYARWKTCAVRVSLRPSWNKDEGSWRLVRTLALKIGRDCVVPGWIHLTNGGTDTMGEEDGIQVDLFRNQAGEGEYMLL